MAGVAPSLPEDAEGAGRIKHLLLCTLKEITFEEHTAIWGGGLGKDPPWEMWNESTGETSPTLGNVQ